MSYVCPSISFFVFGAADRLRPWNFQFLGESGSFLYISHNSYSDSLCVMMTFFVKTPLTLEFCFRSVYKELHADHETGAADNK